MSRLVRRIIYEMFLIICGGAFTMLIWFCGSAWMVIPIIIAQIILLYCGHKLFDDNDGQIDIKLVRKLMREKYNG